MSITDNLDNVKSTKKQATPKTLADLTDKELKEFVLLYIEAETLKDSKDEDLKLRLGTALIELLLEELKSA